MAFNWSVPAMDYNVSQDGHTNVVTTVHWRCYKTDDNGNTGSAYSTVALGPPGTPFVEWDDITETMAVDWAKAAMGAEEVAAVEAGIDAQIEALVNPTTGEGVPWT